MAKTYTQEDIDKLLAERLKEYETERTAWIEMKHGYTYVGYNVLDQITEHSMEYLRMLLRLMNVDFSIKHPFGEDKQYYLILKGEDKARAEFIQKFFDNGYRLNW